MSTDDMDLLAILAEADNDAAAGEGDESDANILANLLGDDGGGGFVGDEDVDLGGLDLNMGVDDLDFAALGITGYEEDGVGDSAGGTAAEAEAEAAAAAAAEPEPEPEPELEPAKEAEPLPADVADGNAASQSDPGHHHAVELRQQQDVPVDIATGDERGESGGSPAPPLPNTANYENNTVVDQIGVDSVGAESEAAVAAAAAELAELDVEALIADEERGVAVDVTVHKAPKPMGFGIKFGTVGVETLVGLNWPGKFAEPGVEDRTECVTHSFLPSFLPCFLPSFLPSLLPSFHSLIHSLMMYVTLHHRGGD